MFYCSIEDVVSRIGVTYHTRPAHHVDRLGHLAALLVPDLLCLPALRLHCLEESKMENVVFNFLVEVGSTNFVQVSRVNHSCGPKCEVVWNAEYRSLDIRLRKLIRRSLTSCRAVLAVEEGEEVTVNCLAVSDGLSRSVRQRSLQKIYG